VLSLIESDESKATDTMTEEEMLKKAMEESLQESQSHGI